PDRCSGARAFSRSFVYFTREMKLSSTTYRALMRSFSAPERGSARISFTTFSTGLKRKLDPEMSGTEQKRQVKGQPRVVWISWKRKSRLLMRSQAGIGTWSMGGKLAVFVMGAAEPFRKASTNWGHVCSASP